EQRLERRTDRLGLERVEQDAGAAVLDVFAEAAPRGDDRLAARHRLEPGERKVLRARWERANRGAVDVALDVGREPDEADVRQTVIAHHLAGADEHETGPRHRPRRLEERGRLER